jgi:hypothetical protein
MRTLIAIGLALWASGASAATGRLLGPGTHSCGFWQEERRTPGVLKLGFEAWVLGFLSRAGLDETLNKVSGLNITAGTDVKGLSAWIDNYCRDNPLDDVATAAAALEIYLRKRR